MRIDQLAINSVSTRQSSLEEALAAYAAAGFKNVEFPIPQITEWMGDSRPPADFKALLDSFGLRCIGGFECGLAAFASPDDQAANFAVLADRARLLSSLGATALVVGTDGPSGPVDDPLGILADAFARLAATITDTGVTLCIEFNWSPIVKSLRTAVEIARRSGAPNVGVLFDTAHYHCTPSKFDQINAASVPFIKHVHVNDMRDKPGELSNCNADRVLPGQGCLDLKSIFGALDQYGYAGYYSIELFNDDLWAMPVAEASRLLYDSLLPFCA
jgi:4-hydroxyphenylpyruvate dioxygenase